MNSTSELWTPQTSLGNPAQHRHGGLQLSCFWTRLDFCSGVNSQHARVLQLVVGLLTCGTIVARRFLRTGASPSDICMTSEVWTSPCEVGSGEPLTNQPDNGVPNGSDVFMGSWDVVSSSGTTIFSTVLGVEVCNSGTYICAIFVTTEVSFTPSPSRSCLKLGRLPSSSSTNKSWCNYFISEHIALNLPLKCETWLSNPFCQFASGCETFPNELVV